MNKILLILISSILFLSACSSKNADTPSLGHIQNPRKVIIDTDMMEALDDGFAMMMTALSENADVMGITTVSGNTWSAEGVAYAIRQLEIIHRADIPVYQGDTMPLDTIGLKLMKEKSGWAGAASTEPVSDWLAFYRRFYNKEPDFYKANGSAVDFLLHSAHQYPGEITLLAIGPCTNIAKAIEMDSLFARDIKEIIYMGGAVSCPGNTTQYAEFNTLFDARAARICLNAPFHKQTLVSLDVCNTVPLSRERYMSMENQATESVKGLLTRSFHHQELIENKAPQSYVWDVIASALFLDKDILLESLDIRVDINTDPESEAYGQTYESENIELPSITVPIRVNTDRIWELIEPVLHQQ